MGQLFTVNQVIPRTILLPNGQFADVYEVQFTTISNITDTIQIPKAEFNKEEARKRVEGRATELEAVKNL